MPFVEHNGKIVFLGPAGFDSTAARNPQRMVPANERHSDARGRQQGIDHLNQGDVIGQVGRAAWDTIGEPVMNAVAMPAEWTMGAAESLMGVHPLDVTKTMVEYGSNPESPATQIHTGAAQMATGAAFDPLTYTPFAASGLGKMMSGGRRAARGGGAMSLVDSLAESQPLNRLDDAQVMDWLKPDPAEWYMPPEGFRSPSPKPIVPPEEAVRYQEWLKANAMKGPDGQPQRLYHGTGQAFDDFDTQRFGKGAGGNLWGEGVYLTDNPQIAGDYANLYRTNRHTLTDPAELAEYFKPGRIVPSWGGSQDEVLSFNPGTDGRWSVTVRNVSDGRNQRPRTHSTNPEIVGPSHNNVRVQHVVEKNQPPILDVIDRLPDSVRNNVHDDMKEFAPRDFHGPYDGYTPMEMTAYATPRFIGDSLMANNGYGGLKYSGGMATGGEPHTAFVIRNPEQVVPKYPTPEQIQVLRQRFTPPGGAAPFGLLGALLGYGAMQDSQP
jgi:hypothetical protein